MNRISLRSRPTHVLALTLALAAPLAACSSTSTSTTASTTASSTTTSPPATAGGGSATTAAGSSAGGTSAAPVGCAAIAAEIPAVYALPADKTQDSAGVCTVTLAGGDQVEVIWNRNAANAASFATVATGQSPVTVAGATKAVGGADAQGARATVLVDGKGTWQLALTPEYTASRAATQADVDKLAALAAALLAKGS